MNLNSLVAKLVDFTLDPNPFGNVKGKEVFQQLRSYIEEHPDTKVFGFSLKGIESTDASFPRESVVAIAKYYRGERGIFLTDLYDRDLIDNWSYAARAKEQPLVIWNDDNFELIGVELNSSTRTLVEYVLKRRAVLASQAAADLGLSVPNASTRLKGLVTEGHLLRTAEVAESGGIEFIYRAIR